jgi:tetratricopeptide (TPR) repeat protein
MSETPTGRRSVKSLFLEAVALHADERSAFLDRACGGDLQLRQELEQLIREYEESPTATLLAGAEPQPPSRTLTEGELLAGRFRILRFVGWGGMGEVYRASDLELAGEVALKTLRPDLLSDPTFLERFRREVQLARQVTHPNVCRIFDVGRHQSEARDVIFLTMEFLDGETLAAALRRTGRMPSGAALLLVRQIADGLTALHHAAIVHRDLKPGNIMIVQPPGSLSPRAVITDFGLAHALEDEGSRHAAALSSTGHVTGTPEYMAPEQLIGKPCTPAVDIYAFGLILYEMAAGRRAFASSRGANPLQRLHEMPVSPRQYAPDLSQEWEAVILGCLATAPEERPLSAAGVVAGLLGALPPSPAERARRTKRRTWIAASILLLCVACFALWRYAFGPPPRQHVAVLSFNVPDGDPSLRVFADGLMESIAGRLSQYERENARLLVVPASEVRQQNARTPSDARRKFGAGQVVEGNLQSQEGRVRLLLTLVDTSQSSQTETVVVEDQRANAFNLQDAAVERLAAALQLRMRAEYLQEARNQAPLAPGAYDFYLQARGYLQRNDQIQSLASAVVLLQRALALDPKFALAQSGLAQAYFYQFKLTRDPATLEAALAAGKQALALNPKLPEANIAMGQIFYGTGRHEEARQSFQKAIAAAGRNNEAYQGLAAAYLGLKDYTQAEATYQKAISLRPSDWTGYKALGLFYYEREAYEKAAAQFQRVVDLTPDNVDGFVNLGAAQSGREDWDAAEKAWLRAQQLDPKNAATLSNLGRIYLDRGQNARAIEMYRRSLALNSRSYRAWGGLGRAWLRTGDRDQANQALTGALKAIDAEIAINPKRFTLYSSQAFYRALAGRKDYAAPITRAIELAPDNGDVLERAAETYAIAGDRQRAGEFLGKAIARGVPAKSIERSEYLKGLKPVSQAPK